MLGQSNNTTADLLEEFGMIFSPGRGPAFVDYAKAEGYIHHSRMPVALAAMAAISPSFARGRFPKVRLVDMVAKRPAMDEDEAVALAEIGGAEVEPPFWSNQPPFHHHLVDVVNRHGIGHLFYHEAKPHSLKTFRPLGYADDQPGRANLAKWPAKMKQLNAGRQMLVATIVTLYRGDADDKTWLGRWSNWHAADALTVIRGDTELCRDWHKLVALYPGW